MSTTTAPNAVDGPTFVTLNVIDRSLNLCTLGDGNAYANTTRSALCDSTETSELLLSVKSCSSTVFHVDAYVVNAPKSYVGDVENDSVIDRDPPFAIGATEHSTTRPICEHPAGGDSRATTASLMFTRRTCPCDEVFPSLNIVNTCRVGVPAYTIGSRSEMNTDKSTYTGATVTFSASQLSERSYSVGIAVRTLALNSRYAAVLLIAVTTSNDAVAPFSSVASTHVTTSGEVPALVQLPARSATTTVAPTGISTSTVRPSAMLGPRFLYDTDSRNRSPVDTTACGENTDSCRSTNGTAMSTHACASSFSGNSSPAPSIFTSLHTLPVVPSSIVSAVNVSVTFCCGHSRGIVHVIPSAGASTVQQSTAATDPIPSGHPPDVSAPYVATNENGFVLFARRESVSVNVALYATPGPRFVTVLVSVTGDPTYTFAGAIAVSTLRSANSRCVTHSVALLLARFGSSHVLFTYAYSQNSPSV